MKMYNKLLLASMLIFGLNATASASALVTDLTLTKLSLNSSIEIHVELENNYGSAFNGICIPAAIYLRKSTNPQFPDPYLIEDADYYKMLWGTLNTAIALGRTVDLTVEPSGFYCNIIGVKINDEDVAP